MTHPEVEKLQNAFNGLLSSGASREKCLEAELKLRIKQMDVAETALMGAKGALRSLREGTINREGPKAYARRMLHAVLGIEKGSK